MQRIQNARATPDAQLCPGAAKTAQRFLLIPMVIKSPGLSRSMTRTQEGFVMILEGGTAYQRPAPLADEQA
jgi:hypothetical protein